MLPKPRLFVATFWVLLDRGIPGKWPSFGMGSCAGNGSTPISARFDCCLLHVFCQCFELNLWMFVPRFGEDKATLTVTRFFLDRLLIQFETPWVLNIKWYQSLHSWILMFSRAVDLQLRLWDLGENRILQPWSIITFSCENVYATKCSMFFSAIYE